MKQLSLFAAILFFSISQSGQASAPMELMSVKSKSKKDQQLLVELTGKESTKESDIELYAQIVGSYQAGDELSLKSRLQSLLRRFPQSVYADNALYIAGMIAVQNKNYPEAIRNFSRVEKEYPASDKVSAAKFARAMTYKKINLPDFSKKLLTQVRKNFPGSPESFRAESELKIIK